jgi:hypothetical protein
VERDEDLLTQVKRDVVAAPSLIFVKAQGLVPTIIPDIVDGQKSGSRVAYMSVRVGNGGFRRLLAEKPQGVVGIACRGRIPPASRPHPARIW